MWLGVKIYEVMKPASTYQHHMKTRKASLSKFNALMYSVLKFDNTNLNFADERLTTNAEDIRTNISTGVLEVEF